MPFLLAIRQASIKQSYFYGFIFGLISYAICTRWVIDFVQLFKAYSPLKAFCVSIIFWLYCAQLPSLLGFFYRCLIQYTQFSPLFIFPLLVVISYAFFPMLIPQQLGESQSHFPLALQAIEFTGVYGLDAIIALVNILLARLIAERLSVKRFSWCVALAVLFVWFVYGAFSLHFWDNKIAQWSTVRTAMIQPNEFPKLQKLAMLPGFSRAYPPEMEMTQRLSNMNVELVIWPEARYKGYIDYPHVREAFANNVREAEVLLLFQDMNILPVQEEGGEQSQFKNTVIALDKSGKELGRYQKIKRIPFGEYIPLVDDIPYLSSWLRAYLGGFLGEIDAGSATARFDFDGLSLIPLVCYETMFPRFVAGAVGDKAGGLLVGVSSDAWFGRSTLPFQHTNSSALRAVENRLPFAHVLNNGPSLVVLPSGRFLFRSTAHQAGAFVVDIPYATNEGGSFFSRHPSLFLSVCCVLFVLLVLFAFWRRVNIVVGRGSD